MRRRTFMAGAAALAAGAAGMRTARAAAGERIRCGVLGIGHAHGIDLLKVLRASPDYEFLGLCEPDAAVREKWRDDPALRDVRWLSEAELLGDPRVRMVAIESNVPRLLELAMRAVRAGKHIHLDKPAGTSLPEFQALLDEAARRDLLVQMGYMFRYNPGFDLVRRAVKEGWIGDVYAIHASMCTDLPADARARMNVHPGGLMLELGCHLIDMIVLLQGAPQKVSSFLRHSGPFDDTLADNTCAVLEYDKALVTVETAAMEPLAFGARRFKVAGTNGSIILSPLEPPHARLALREDVPGYKAGVHEMDLPDLERHVLDVADLALCIRGEKIFEYAKQHDLEVQRTVLRACGENV